MPFDLFRYSSDRASGYAAVGKAEDKAVHNFLMSEIEQLVLGACVVCVLFVL
jgi:hypothetical protein